MSRTFQRLETFGTLSVRDNVLVAAEMRRGWSRDKSDPAAVTDDVIDRIGLGAVAPERVDTLPTGTARSRRGGARAGGATAAAVARRTVGRSERERDRRARRVVALARRRRPRGAPRRARHGIRDGHLLAHPRPRLRHDHRDRHARGSAGEPIGALRVSRRRRRPRDARDRGRSRRRSRRGHARTRRRGRGRRRRHRRRQPRATGRGRAVARAARRRRGLRRDRRVVRPRPRAAPRAGPRPPGAERRGKVHHVEGGQRADRADRR